ncbi:uncharacterized protein PGTG_01866 [Puccinia graminis f. sp. tritici CRL 75-36-700-3]|uniref:Uncharacterized protein n=4 Tax=Puccinia graminis f. sp. tritici TaxID=56615 RepID=E3JT46_PUCGT|nr:uncharacterized protein PGTG_01866 [Puccinia graminis f. sp. tritici CRL 75-36-700-3]EFP75273.2 hypothetical protein PGTG_01866 [Puccinia graminis f. sp. tritici CRL 75-36-700-3]
MKTYRNRKLPMSIFLGAILVFSSLIIFNLFTQGRSDKSRPFISLKFLDEKLHSHGKSPSGYKYSCDTATVRMGDNVFMVIPSEPPDEPMTESEGQLGSPGAFQWTVYEITRADREEKKNEFRYRGQKLNCVVTFVKAIYQFMHHNYIYSICGNCTYLDTNGTTETLIRMTLCTTYDHSTANIPSAHRKGQPEIRTYVYEVLEKIFPTLSIPPSTMPLSVYPPYYNETQSNIYRNQEITRRNVSQLTIWLGNVTFIPAADLSDVPSQLTPGTIVAPQGTVLVENLSNPGSYFEAFKKTDEKSSGFQISVVGVGEVRPFRQHEYNLTKIPLILAQMFNYSYSINGLLMNLAAADLNQKEIGTHYLCNATRKEWLPGTKVFSATFGNSMGTFGICFSIMVLVARRLDNLPTRQRETDRQSDSSGTLHLEEGEDHPLKNIEK